MKTKDNLLTLITDIQEVWNPQRFELEREPHVIGEIQNRPDFDGFHESVLDMPIKLPYSDIRIPKSLQKESIIQMVEDCMMFEKSINPNMEQYYAYLTIHHSHVQANKTQRRAGAHIDGMQGVRYPEKFPVCHSYLVSNCVPTRFYTHPFQTDLCIETQNWFYEFDNIKNEEHSLLSEPYQITLMTAYSVHESTPAEKEEQRTFVRLEFSLKEFNRIGNTINPLFDLNWNYEERPIPKHLAIENFN